MNSYQTESCLLNSTAPTTVSFLTPSFNCLANLLKKPFETNAASTAENETSVKLGEEHQSSSTSSLLKWNKSKVNFTLNSATSSILHKNSSNSLFSHFESPCSTRELNEPSTSLPSSSSSSTPFIDPSELKRMFDSSMSKLSKIFVILLDCRTYGEFTSKHIRDSVHLNCRDKLTKKRLQTRKLTVKDLISCEEVKSKFDSSMNNSNSDLSKLAFQQVKRDGETTSSTNNNNNNNNSNNIIVIYDDTTSDLNDLQSDANPLKIVQENIKQSGFKKECKILKGGFKKFSEMCPEFCVLKEAQVNNLKCNREPVECDLRQADIENAVMTQILPFLYLGNELDAKNINKLEQNAIHYVLNVTKNIPFYEATNRKFKLKRIAVNDNETQNLKDHFEEAIEFIEEARNANAKVLVHCQAGISRSPTIVIAYLMKLKGLKFNDAYNRVRELRPIIAPNLIFMSQLMDYETKLSNTCNPFTFVYEDSLDSFSPSPSPTLSASTSPSSASDSSSSSSPSTSSTTDDGSAFFSNTAKNNTNTNNNTILVCN